jgi:addiction module HigA family antidote
MSKSPTTTKAKVKKEGDKLPPIPPGEILRTEFLDPLNLSATKLASYMGVAPTRVTAILDKNIHRAITADTALRLSFVFGTSPDFWLNLQSNYEIAMLDYLCETDKIRKQVREFTRA